MEGGPDRRTVGQEEINALISAALHEGGLPLQQTVKDQAQRELAGSARRQPWPGGDTDGIRGGTVRGRPGEGANQQGGEWCAVEWCGALYLVRGLLLLSGSDF